MEHAEKLGLDLQLALRRLAKAVVVITTSYDGQRYAMAATAVSELSLDPPSMLICVNKTASICAPLTEGAPFCINILHSSHEHIARSCTGATKGEARFETGNWIMNSEGKPFLEDAQANIFCEIAKVVEFGTHKIFIGRADEVLYTSEVDPLIYVDGKYR